MESKNEEKNSDKEIEKKLSDLLNIGWILLDEKCPLETCDCPLLKSFDGNKYCVKCEMWQFPDQVKVKQKYTDLVVKSSQELALRETRLAKVYKNSADNVCRELEKACECEGGTYAYRSLYTGSATL